MRAAYQDRAPWPPCAAPCPYPLLTKICRFACAEKLETVATRTDDNIDDEEAGRARAVLAEASRQRREAEAAQLASENAEYREKVQATGTRTDDDIDDEAAGIARKELAEASRQRKSAEAHELADENEKMARRMKKVGAAIDDDLDDEAAGMARKELAERSKLRRSKEAEELRARNEEMRARLAHVKSRTDDGDGLLGGEEQFGSASQLQAQLVPLERETTLTAVQYQRFKAWDENRERAGAGRVEKDEFREEKVRHAGEWQALGAARVRERRERDQRMRVVKSELQKQRRDAGHGLREEEAKWQQQREQEVAELHERVKLAVIEARSLDSRLDFAEAKVDAKEVRTSYAAQVAHTHTHTRTLSHTLHTHVEVQVRGRSLV